MAGLTRLPHIDFRFVEYDVEKQHQIAGEMLREAEEIQRVLERDEQIADRAILERARDLFLKSAKALAENANTTSASATTVISTVTASST